MIHYLKRGAEAAIVAALKTYQWLLSPLMPPTCRFTPTCSNYAIEAVKSHGPFHGVLLAAWRLARCHPFSNGGYDPVPQPRHRRSSE